MSEALARWVPLLDGLLWERRAKAKNGFELRSVALELTGGGTAVYSPCRGLDPQELVTHAGRVRYLLSPNHFHHLGIARWRDKCPGALATCAAGAKDRLVKKLDVSWTDLEELRAHLPASARIIVPEGTKTGEVWWEVCRGDERVLVVCDAFFNLSELPAGLAGLFCRVTATGPGLSLGKTFKYLHLSDTARYRDFALEYLSQHPPTTLVCAHGDIVKGADLAERLRELITTRL